MRFYTAMYSNRCVGTDVVFVYLTLSVILNLISLCVGTPTDSTVKTYQSVCPEGCPDSCDSQGTCNQCSQPGLGLPYCNEPCVKGRYGMNCEQECSDLCMNHVCDQVSGNCSHCAHPGVSLPECTTSCRPGTFGDNCRGRCPLVCPKSCDPISGDCAHCVVGEGPLCSVNCAEKGQFQTCQRYCPNKCIAICATANGECGLCSPGFKSPFCNESCSIGFYGSDCRERCSDRCTDQHCNPMTGLCDRGCIPGYVGDTCNGQCVAGYFGQDCFTKCPETCANQRCHFSTGVCLNCSAGFTGSLCQDVCPEGKHGANCVLDCPENCGGKCQPMSGLCWSCDVGWQGELCNETCPVGQYGELCSSNCSINCLDNMCHHITGDCLQCKPNFHGNLCTQMLASLESQKVNVVVMALVGFLAPASVIGTCLLIYKYCMNRKARKYERRKLEALMYMSEMKQAPGLGILEPLSSSSKDPGIMNTKQRKTMSVYKAPTNEVGKNMASVSAIETVEQDLIAALLPRKSKSLPKIYSRPQRAPRISKTSNVRITSSSSESSTLKVFSKASGREYESTENTYTLRSSVSKVSPAPRSLSIQSEKAYARRQHDEHDSVFKFQMAYDFQQPASSAMTTQTTATVMRREAGASLDDLQYPHSHSAVVKTTMSARARLKDTSADRTVSQVKLSMTHSGNEASVDSLYGLKSTELSMNSLSFPIQEKSTIHKDKVSETLSVDISAEVNEQQPGRKETKVTIVKSNSGSVSSKHESYDKPKRSHYGEKCLQDQSRDSKQRAIRDAVIEEFSTKIARKTALNSCIDVQSQSHQKEHKVQHDPILPVGEDESVNSDTTFTFPYHNLDQMSEGGQSTFSEATDCAAKAKGASPACVSEKTDTCQEVSSASYSEYDAQQAANADDKFEANFDKQTVFEKRNSVGRSRVHTMRGLSTVVETEVLEAECSEVVEIDAYRRVSKSEEFTIVSVPESKRARMASMNYASASTSTGDLYLTFPEETQTTEPFKGPVSSSSHFTNSSADSLSKQEWPQRTINNPPEFPASAPSAHSVTASGVQRCPITRQVSPMSSFPFVKPNMPGPKALPTPPFKGKRILHPIPIQRPSNTSQISEASSNEELPKS